MCGVSFLHNPELDSDERRRRTERALGLMHHRGPDDQGQWDEHPLAIGHRRLAIIDLGASRQPMCDRQNRFVLSYNGEVYNFRELRAQLEPHWDFRTHGDTEVVLAGLALHGPAFLARMEGMWAIVLWDRTKRSLLLARDRMGKKPLYYVGSGAVFAAASELPALAALDAHPWREDPDSTADFFRFGFYLPGYSAYLGVREVLPGHMLEWQPGAGVRDSRYWSLSVGGYSGDREAARGLLRDRLVRAVERRLVADVEVGAFLSGGIDSSLVVGILCAELGIRPKTFTIGFTDPAFDERRYADLVARRYGTDHYAEVLSGWEDERLKALVFDHLGQPFADASLLPSALVSGVAARHVKVALSGDGGDELFSGYQRYQGRTLMRWYARLPSPLRRSIERLIDALPEPMAHHSRSLLKKAHLFRDLVNRQLGEHPYVAPTFYSPQGLARLVPDLAGRGHRPPGLPDEARQDQLLEMMAGDALVYLPQDILVKVDRASMSHSLEARAPFLDRDVVELAFSLPTPWHRRRGVGKRMLRETFSRLLPRVIWSRRKQGFGVPIHRWFREKLGRDLDQLLNEAPMTLNGSCVREMLDMHRSGRRDHGYRLWSIYIYLLWHQRRLTSAS